MNKLTKIIKSIINIATVRKCVACGELLEYDREGYMCHRCETEWFLLKREVCPNCFEAHVDCRCGFKKGYVDSVRHLVAYSNEEKDCVSNKLVYALKKSNDDDVFEFVANEMADNLINKSMLKNAVVAAVPRNPVAIRRYGYDHAKKLAKRLAQKLDVAYVDVLAHSGGKTEQKMLNMVQREQNARKNVYLISDNVCLIKNKTVILVDDIGTTGAMTGVCGEILKKNGAKRVCCVLAAKNERK